MPTEYPEDDSRTAPFQTAAASESSVRRAPESKTRYVDVPQSPERAVGPRNLAWGVIFLVVALCAFWFARIVSARDVTLCLVASLGTFGLAWLFYNLRILRQRNGIFLALSVILLFGAAMPLVVRGLSGLDRLARERLGDEPQSAKLDVAPPPAPTAKTAPPAPPTPDLPPPAEEEVRPPKAVDDGVVRELLVPPPPATAKQVIEIQEDVETVIDGRRMLVKKGDTFEFISIKDGQTSFKAGAHLATVNSDIAKFKLSFKELNALAQKEAVRRYPGIGEKFSEQNEQYVAAARELGDTLPDFKKSPQWPLDLAVQLAGTHGWKSVDDLEEEAKAEKPAPEKAPEAPSEPPSETAPLPDVPQENPLPPAGR